MKLKVLLLSVIFCFMQVSPLSYAKRYSHRLPKAPQYSSSSIYGRTHIVKHYFKKNGTFVQRHRAGNPRSGVHCHNNICY